MKEAVNGMVDGFTGLTNLAHANGGKIADVNEILWNVISEKKKENGG